MRKRILIMEDDPDVKNLIFAILGGAYDVLGASNGKEGMEVMVKSRADLVITDREMPGGPLGEQVVRDIKAQYPGVKVVFMTGRPTPQIMLAAQAAGADATLAKPFNVGEMESIVQELLQ